MPPPESWPRKRVGDTVRDTIAVARLVTDSRGFIKRELRSAARPPRYVLRRGRRPILIRHGTADVGVVHEIFVRDAYRLPPRVMRSLHGLGRAIRAADLGANVGLFGIYLLDALRVSALTAFEPDAANLKLLTQCAAADGGADCWRIVEACAATSNGRVPFTAGRFTRSGIATDGQGAGITLVDAVDVFDYLDGADLLKMDIEGGEWPILSDARFSSASATVVLEYHPQMCPYPGPRRAVVSLLQRAGDTIRRSAGASGWRAERMRLAEQQRASRRLVRG